MPESEDRLLAQVTLVALRAALPVTQEALSGLYAILPRLAPMKREAAVNALAVMPKPVRCTAIALDGILAIAAWPLEHRLTGHWPESFAHRLETQEQYPRARLLFKVDGEEPLVLNAQNAIRWQNDYQVLGLGVSWAWDDNDPLARLHDATAVVGLTRVHS
ncbi:MAG: hypothetical protein ACJ79K_05180 [Gemmatimonadaceae bacterium]